MGCLSSRPLAVQPGPPTAMTPPAPPLGTRPPSRLALLLTALGGSKKRGKRFTREQRQLIKKYLPSIPIFELSTPLHCEVAGHHWNEVYRDGSLSNTSKRSQSSWGREGSLRQQPPASSTTTPIRELYDTFYVYLEQHSPELMPVFRASMHVRSKVLVHISAGMRSILLAKEDMVTKLLQLTQTHLRVGVRLEHFDPLARALFHAMEKTSGEHWTPEVEHAWRRLFVHCSALLMVEQRKTAASQQSKGPGQLLSSEMFSSPKSWSIREQSSSGHHKSSLGRQPQPVEASTIKAK